MPTHPPQIDHHCQPDDHANLLSNGPWYVYLVSCRDDTLYCGITTNLARRLKEHNQGRAGAKYTRARRPVRLVFSRMFPNRAKAASFEYRLKRLDRAQKLLLTQTTTM